MRNKKGFTLIEVLGVIIVLGIISSIAVVTIDNNIKKGKVTVCLAQQANIIESAKSYFVDHPDKANKKVTILTLKNDGYLDKDLKNPMTDEFYSENTYVFSDDGEYKITYVDETDCEGAGGKTMEEILADLSVMKSWSGNTNVDFHAAEYRENITHVIFEDNINIPTGTTSWDISNKGNSSVMAWLTTDPSDNTKYILHIAGKNGVVANTNSSAIFYNFSNVKDIDFSNNFDTSTATDMSLMFYGCSKLTSLDVTKFDTSKVTSMKSMFTGCRNLTSLNVSNFDTSKVTAMDWMFAGCNKLTSLDVTNFDTSKVTDMSAMFMNCTTLTTLDVSNFDTSNVIAMGGSGLNFGMFGHCENLTTIYVSNRFVVSKVTNSDNMFLEDTKLVGGNGTKHNSSKIDKEYARIDTASTPGYFTKKA